MHVCVTQEEGGIYQLGWEGIYGILVHDLH